MVFRARVVVPWLSFRVRVAEDGRVADVVCSPEAGCVFAEGEERCVAVDNGAVVEKDVAAGEDAAWGYVAVGVLCLVEGEEAVNVAVCIVCVSLRLRGRLCTSGAYV